MFINLLSKIYSNDISISNERICPGCGCTCPCECKDCKECSTFQ